MSEVALLEERQLSTLRDRAQMLAEARRFFAERGVMEVDCPILGRSASVDENIDLLSTRFGGRERLFLHSSPEYGMKRLLARGVGDIYQLSHVFRDGERGSRHRPEFSMAEWYRCGFSFQEMIDETVLFASLFQSKGEVCQLTYRAALQEFAGVDPYTASLGELRAAMEENGIGVGEIESRDELLNLIVGCLVEPQLTGDCWWVVTHFPASQAALAATVEMEGALVAERFELYADGLELANGYHELAEPEEQRSRLEAANRHRIAHGKEALPIDESLIEALRKGLPDCCGVAVGFDRLMMLRWGTSSIHTILSEEMWWSQDYSLT